MHARTTASTRWLWEKSVKEEEKIRPNIYNRYNEFKVVKMTETSKYEEIFVESWKELCRKYNSKEFEPYQEQDMICLLYHLCLERLKDAKLIHVNSTHGFDLTLGEILPLIQLKKPDKTKYQNLMQCLIAEVKHIKRKGRKGKVLKKALGDIKKLVGKPAQSRVLAIFDEAGSMGEGEVKELKEYGKKSGVIVHILGRRTSPA